MQIFTVCKEHNIQGRIRPPWSAWKRRDVRVRGWGIEFAQENREILALQSQPKSSRSPDFVQTFIQESGDSLKLCGMIKMCRSGGVWTGLLALRRFNLFFLGATEPGILCSSAKEEFNIALLRGVWSWEKCRPPAPGIPASGIIHQHSPAPVGFMEKGERGR